MSLKGIVKCRKGTTLACTGIRNIDVVSSGLVEPFVFADRFYLINVGAER